MTHTQIRALSGFAGETAQAYQVTHEATSILLDAGAPCTGWLKHIETRPDLVVISHAHDDHVGGLIKLREKFPRARVVATPRTRDLLQAALSNRVDASRALAICDTVEPMEFHRALELGPFEIELLPSGHIMGAAMVRVDSPSGSLLYTSDFALDEKAPWGAARVGDFRPGTLIMEGALAGVQRLDDWDREAALGELSSWLGSSGPRLLAVDAIGLGAFIASALADHDMVVHRSVELEHDATLVDMRGAEQALRAGKLVVAAARDLDEASVAGRLVDTLLTDSSGRLALFNALPANSRAQRIASSPRRSRLVGFSGRPRLKARVRRFDWPLHARGPDLIEFARTLEPQTLLLTHGQLEALHRLRRCVQKQAPEVDVHVIESRDAFAL